MRASTIIDKKRAELMPMLSGGAGLLLSPVAGLLRLAVKEPVFVNFVMNNRERVPGRLASPA